MTFSKAIAIGAIPFILGTAAMSQPPTRRATAIVLSEIVNEQAPYPSSHASTIAQTTSGRLVAAWFGGTGERHPDVGIWFARRGNAHWEQAVEVANGLQPDGTRYPTWNPVLFQPPKGPLFLFYKVGSSTAKWWGMVMTSGNDGQTWTGPQRLPDGVLGPIRNKPVVLPGGAWLSGSSTEASPTDWRVHFELSRNAGETWTAVGPIDRGAGFDAIQPTMLFPGYGRIEALCRTKQGVIAMTWSSDGGRTWTPLAAAALPNPNSAVDGVTLTDGRLLLVYNHAAHNPEWSGHGRRYPLDVAISRDGLTWVHVLTLEDQPERAGARSRPITEPPARTSAEQLDIINKGFAYPAVIQTSDGLVHVTYTIDRHEIKHVVIDPKRLR